MFPKDRKFIQIFRRANKTECSFEQCFYLELERALTTQEYDLIRWLIADPFNIVSEETGLKESEFIEIGPRLSVETPFSSSAVAICQSMGLPMAALGS